MSIIVYSIFCVGYKIYIIVSEHLGTMLNYYSVKL